MGTCSVKVFPPVLSLLLVSVWLRATRLVAPTSSWPVGLFLWSVSVVSTKPSLFRLSMLLRQCFLLLLFFFSILPHKLPGLCGFSDCGLSSLSAVVSVRIFRLVCPASLCCSVSVFFSMRHDFVLSPCCSVNVAFKDCKCNTSPAFPCCIVFVLYIYCDMSLSGLSLLYRKCGLYRP